MKNNIRDDAIAKLEDLISDFVAISRISLVI